MARLFIHAGMGKTGTSSIQVSLLQNREVLAEQGIVAIESNQSKPDVSSKHRLKWRNHRSREWRHLKKEASKLARTDKTVILSNETLWKKDESERQLLRKIFKNFDVTILIYVREQVEFLESRALQAMKRTKMGNRLYFGDNQNPKGMEKFFEKFDPYMDYLAIARGWEDVFGKGSVMARLYSRDVFSGGNVVEDFFEAVGAETDALDLSTMTNPSLSVPFAAISKDRARFLPDVESKSEVIDAAFRFSKIRKTNLPRLISPEKAEEIRKRAAESNRTFFKEYVVNGDEFTLREWKKGDTFDLKSLANEMQELIDSWPLILLMKYGPVELSPGIYREGWRVDKTSNSCRAEQVGDRAAIRFRIHTRARLRMGEATLKLRLQTMEDTARRIVTVNNEVKGVVDLAKESIPVSTSELGEFDNAEVLLQVEEGVESPLTITNVFFEGEDVDLGC